MNPHTQAKLYCAHNALPIKLPSEKRGKGGSNFTAVIAFNCRNPAFSKSIHIFFTVTYNIKITKFVWFFTMYRNINTTFSITNTTIIKRIRTFQNGISTFHKIFPFQKHHSYSVFKEPPTAHGPSGDCYMVGDNVSQRLSLPSNN